MKTKIIPVFLPENQCPFNCSFCNVKVANGDVSIKGKSDIIELIKQSLESLKKHHPESFKEVAFFGGTFTYGDKETIESYLQIVKPYIEKGEINGIRVSTRPDFFDNEIVELFKKYGVLVVEFGVQSFSDKVLKAVKRGHRAEIAEKAVLLSKRHGFKTSVHLMAGLPEQTAETFLKDVKKAIELKVDYVRIHPLVVLKNTLLAEQNYKAPDCSGILPVLSAGVYLLRKSGVKIIKLGLQPTDSLNAKGSVLSGCYHQSLKHLVYSEIYGRFLKKKIEEGVKEIAVSPSDYSYFKGYRGANRDLIEKIRLKKDNNIERETVRINGEKLSIFKEQIYEKVF